ncbi:MAG: hypothetical protein AAB774_02710 [Patescibacteria group bacterium]
MGFAMEKKKNQKESSHGPAELLLRTAKFFTGLRQILRQVIQRISDYYRYRHDPEYQCLAHDD